MASNSLGCEQGQAALRGGVTHRAGQRVLRVALDRGRQAEEFIG